MTILRRLFSWLERFDEDETPEVVIVANVEMDHAKEEKERLRRTLDKTGNQLRDRLSQGRR